jgi:hypothetical protein
VHGLTCQPVAYSLDPFPPACDAGPMTNEDIKAKMREALERKQANDRGVDDEGHKKEKGHGPETHGPLGGVQMHRRKAGGGGS